jgi:hypothetical protein
MGKKNVVVVKAKAKAKKPAKAAIAVVPHGALVAVEARVAELEGDLQRLVELVGGQLGEPFRALAKEIVAKRQGSAPVEAEAKPS